MNDQKINFLLNHSEPSPLNFFIRFKFRSKKAANHDYEKRLNQAIQHDPSSKKLLDLKGRLDMGGYKNDWTRYEDWRDNRKANSKIKKKKRQAHIEFHSRLDNDLNDGYYERSGDESGQGSEVDDNLSREETQVSYPTIHERTNEQANNYNVQYVFANIMAFPALKEYCEILKQLEDHHLEEESQRVRHLFKLLSWSVVDSKLFPAQNPICYPDLWKPTANFGIIIAALKDTRHQKLQDAVPVLNRIIREGKIGIVRSGIISTIQRWLGLEPADFVIDAPTALSALTSILLFVPSPVRPGADPSENHFKSQLWTKILSDAFSLNVDPFDSTWELHHQIPGDSGKGSARSDFACVAISLITKEQYPFFILEFEVGGVQVHKDYAVVIAEASHALNRILSTHMFSESEISLIRVHVALVNNAHIRLGILRPLYSQEYNTTLYIYDQDVKSFDLQSNCIGTNIENVFKLIVYLRQVVCKDGLYLRNLLGERISEKKRKFNFGLPRLPSEAEKSRLPKVNFTPKAKRVRYEVYSTYAEELRESSPSPNYCDNLSMLLEESCPRNVNQQVIDEIDSSITGSSSMKISNLLN
ncbi:hypothetical protein RhiirA5_493892 [Rhizophagus irregularis]|uniref:Uncharacterized protein n=4 Tax=Rhizophagus irregularis TaxID=588596 RepID=A0A2I1ENJ2_9GLOM|nr:hypothetical protein RirG_197950 [Rhizophagus irregularis DAOM 197198w]PKC16316.1 hypothetical protein RhiirA5_493892 [Rhizophagus irregularis]GBC45855.2 hypothetical protein GLOIN_2v1543548 [Rhizophagus irregularis DAOM 181602=DAOM 197198]PKC64430.1 hypothetical protein RhiirA1_537046 [Rhizophagus irregularis]PKY23665.1 hypothetical protein RhiirB3_526671 [Rhizophagus irregularis]